MTLRTALKLGQIAGVLLLAAGVTSCSLHREGFTLFFVLGALIYGGCRIAAWLREK